MKVKKCTNFIEKRGIIQNYKIMYLKNQKILGETVLLGGIYYEIKNEKLIQIKLGGNEFGKAILRFSTTHFR